ncbi:MAG: hypothetical protein AAFV62_07045 [Pseudomonadota bacterium]
MLLTFLGAMKLFETDIGQIDVVLAIGTFFLMLSMSLAPKLLGILDVACTPGGAARYGGAGRFALSSAVETVFGMLMAPAVALRLTIFLAGLPFGQKIGWSGQIRDAYGLEWSTAVKALWPQTLFGALLLTLFAWQHPAVLPWAATVIVGLLFAVPFAVLTASPAFGRWLGAKGIAAIPEEVSPVPTLTGVDAQVIQDRRDGDTRDIPLPIAAE